VNPLMLVGSALALAIERVVYGVIWHRPDRFTRFCRGLAPSRDPVDLLSALFVGFKGIQAVVFLAWCVAHGGIAARDSGEIPLLVSGVGLLAAGQILNVSVFLRLGRTGVFYGNRLGHDVPWCEGFPFSAIRHPQYLGTVLSIWGIFVLARYPAPDWAVLPLLETVYYAIGSVVEQGEAGAALMRDEPDPATAAAPPASAPLP
jgi:methylene-fatty-acyl-phospholipid synthase